MFPLTLILALSSLTVVLTQAAKPETFRAQAQVKGSAGGAEATILIAIERYSHEHDRKAVEGALKGGGYPGFLTALRKAPEVGHVEHGKQKYAIRYARQTETDKGYTIVVVTERPVFFVGGGAPDAKPRAGYEVAVLRLEVDATGAGTGSMAAAARVKLAPDGSVQVDDYADEPIALVTVTRQIS
jgi:hypothetical protein